MKKLIVLLFISPLAFGQNLVSNPSFEDTVVCPTADNQLYNCLGWDAFGSPDYFNRCSTFPDVSVPYNSGGYQHPATGDAYVAIGTHGDPSFFYSCDANSCNSHEYLGRYLNTSLSIGTKYYISVKVNLSLSNTLFVNCATDKLGVLFTNNKPLFGIPNPTLIKNYAHIFSSTIITDTLGWTSISGSFVADSTYQYLVIGNFFDDTYTNTQIMDGNTYCNSYYFIDDVCVSIDSLTCNQSVGINEILPNQSIFNVFPNPSEDFINIENSLYNEPYDIRIYNKIGQLLFEEKNVTNQNKKINTNSFVSGLLLINIKAKNQNFYYKLLNL